MAHNINNNLSELLLAARRSTGSAPRPRLEPGPIDTAPVVRLVNGLIEAALLQDASDIHIEPGPVTGRVRYRVNGCLELVAEAIPMALYGHIISRLKILARLNIAETRLPQDGRFSYEFQQQNIDIRVSVVPLIVGEKAVLRLLNRRSLFMDMDALQLSAHNRDKLVRICNQPGGAIIFAGPVNSGKTTVLYSVLHLLNCGDKNIVTIEDPVEYQLPGINQLQVNAKLRLDFEEALSAVLRQDYDVLAIGEIRSDRVAEMMLKASLAGHLVLATIHTAQAAKVIYRLLDMGLKPYLLGIALKGIVAQRLVPKLCPACRQAYTVEQDSPVARFLGKSYRSGVQLYHRQGCDQCQGRGIQGRLAVQEILMVDDKLQECISRRPSWPVLQKVIAGLGLDTLKDDGITKALAGWVEIEEIMQINGE